MKIGIPFDPYGTAHARYGEQRFVKLAQQGFSAVDYGMTKTETELYTMSLSDLEQKMLTEKAAAAEAGIEISQVHGPWRYPPQDSTAELRQERMEKMKKSIWATRVLGCKYWVVHPIMPYGTADLDTGDAQKTWDLNVEFMSELLAYAKTQDVTICLENMPMRRFSMATPSQILKFVKTMNDEHFKICLDTGHVAIFADLSAGDAVRELGKEIRIFHIHDNMGDSDAHMWPTKGITDWENFVKALKEIDFQGVFSLETKFQPNQEDTDFEADCLELIRIVKNLVE